MSTHEIPDAVKADPQKLATLIVSLKLRIKEHTEKSDELKKIKDKADDLLLSHMDASGQTNFNFDGIGRFSPTERVNWNFPPADAGGKSAGVEFVKLLLDRGLLNVEDVMALQQARLSKDAVAALPEMVAAYNEQHPNDPLPESPFVAYRAVTLTSPTKFSKEKAK